MSPFFALFFNIAKIRSCLRILPAFSILSELAKSTNSVTGRCLRSDKCIFFYIVLSIKAINWDFDNAPFLSASKFPSLKIISVGIARTAN